VDPAPIQSATQQWQVLLSRLRQDDVDGEWVKLVAFLKAIGQPPRLYRHAIRFVQPGWPTSWVLANGRAPRYGFHWTYRSGKRGGGNKDTGGPIYVRKTVLGDIFQREYAALYGP
jgi:hypothetical protein